MQGVALLDRRVAVVPTEHDGIAVNTRDQTALNVHLQGGMVFFGV